MLLALIALPAFLLACGDDDDNSADDDGGVANSAPPSAFIRYEPGDAVELVPGTRCWDGTCVDMAGPLTQVVPLQLYAGEPLAFSFEAGIPDEFTVSWTPAPATAPAPEGDVRVWAGLFTGESSHTGSTVPTQVGQYIVTVFAVWQGKGDVSYGLLAEVTPPN